MAYRIRTAEQTRIAALLQQLRDQKAEIEQAAARFAETLAEVQGVYGDIASTARDRYDNASEAWQEGERGSAVAEWIDRLEEIEGRGEIELDLAELDEAIEEIDGMDTEPEAV